MSQLQLGLILTGISFGGMLRMSLNLKYLVGFAIFMMALAAMQAPGQAQESYKLVIKDHRFEPAELEIPAGQKIKLMVDNQDSTPEEFESYELHREKVIPGNSQAAVFIGPLKAGRYKYFGEFHADTAQGVIVAAEAK